MLKKQTVWLLTMLSLMIVLSVYYIFTPPIGDEVAFPGDADNEDLETTGERENDDSNNSNEDNANDLNDSSDAEVTNIANRGQDELYTMMRMEIQNERSMSKERFNNIVKSSSATTDEKNEALNNIQSIEQLSTKETILQEKIMSGTDKYEDVFVRYDNDKVHVHIRVGEMTKEEANHIMQTVRNEFGEVPVEVNFEPAEG